MELFKGYIFTKGKQAVEKFKGRKDFKTYEEVKTAPEFAGILADNVVLIDVDNKAQSELLMDIVEDLQLNCRVYQTTRGRHFLFKNNGIDKCGTGVRLACGLTADIKVGAKNSYSILKFNGEERFIEWDIEEETEYQEVPRWLFPINSKLDFFDMEAGDGRNSSLYKYILTLTNNGFSKSDSRQTIEIINKYVFKDHLTDDEIETITRDEAFPEDTFYDGRTFLHNKFGDFLMNNNHIKRINGLLHVYRDGIYIEGARDIENQMVRYLPSIKAQQRTEVLKYLDVQCLSNTEQSDARYIAFKNGIYDIAIRELLPFNPDIIIINKIPWDYNPKAYSSLLDKTLNKIACGDNEIRAILEEAIGYSFYRRNELSKSFFLTGGGANGKSTYLEIVKDILGMKNISALGLEELGERFSIGYMNGKLANIGDDIAPGFLQGRELANFKKIVSGNIIKAEVKFKAVSDEDNIKPTVKMFFSANEMPRTRSKGFEAVLRRLVKIPFDAKFTPNDEDYDPFIAWKLKDREVMEYGILLGLQGLYRVLENNDFTRSEKVVKELEEYENENNPILQFLEDRELCDIENQPCNEVYRQYKIFCIENGFTEMSINAFGREISKRFGLSRGTKRVDGKVIKIYEKPV